ncbi:MAG: MFS transporter [Thermodesulfobacteriota bacterium]
MEQPIRTSKSALLLVVTVTTFMGPFMVSGVNIILPAISREFAAGAVLMSWVANAYLLATAVMLVPMAKIADMNGRKKIFVAGITLFSLATILIALAPTLWLLIGLRALQGVGAAMISVTGIAIIAAVFPPAQRGRAIGITVAAVYTGLSSGPFAAGYLSAVWGWRSVFTVTFPVGLLSIYLAMAMIKDEWTPARGQPLDVAGICLYGLSLILFMPGLSNMPSPNGFLLLFASLAVFCLFIRQEMKFDCPVVEISLFRNNRGFSFSSLAALINYAATFAVAFYLSLYLQFIKGMTPQTAGLVLICQPVMMAIFSPLAGRLSDRFEPALIASAGMALCATGLFLLGRITAATAIGDIVGTLLLLGLGFALFSSPNMNAIMSSVQPAHYGLASGTVATMRLIGQMLSMAVATMFLAILIGPEQITPANHHCFMLSLHLGFATFCSLCLIGIWFSSARGNIQRS